MTILGIDIGFGFCKVIVGNEFGEVSQKFKFPTMVGITKKLDNVENDNIKGFDENFYMVGENAKHLPSNNLIQINDYKNLEYFGPLLLQHSLDIAKIENPDLIVVGLSIAHIQNSGYFEERLSNFIIDNKEYNYKIIVLPQGAGAKLAVDKYGSNFPNEQKEFLGSTNYILCDIGFNTIDTLMVNNGKTDPNLFNALENSGVMLIAQKIAKLIYEKHSRQITLQEAKDILDSGKYKLRGITHSYETEIKEIKDDFLKNLLKVVDSTYPEFIDKCDFIFLCGGGSTLFKSTNDGFIKTPFSAWEFYNAIGFYLFGLKNI